MKIALLGYGKMGKAIEKEALKKGHTIWVTIDSEKEWETKDRLLSGADMAFEFSMPQTAVRNIIRCFSANVPVVVGTTGWENDYEMIRKRCTDENKTLLTASNFSIGMNIFFEINKQLARLMNRFDNYDVSVEETHHIHKLDKPSGTAKTLAGQIITALDRKTGWVPEKAGTKDQLPVYATREGEVTGIHTVRYVSDMDEIRITHQAFDRQVFAKGALMAAEWLAGKRGCFQISDMLSGTK